VRAYPSSEGASDEATLFTSELRLWLNPNWTVFALYDWAKGRRERDTDPVNFSSNDIQLRGSGLPKPFRGHGGREKTGDGEVSDGRPWKKV